MMQKQVTVSSDEMLTLILCTHISFPKSHLKIQIRYSIQEVHFLSFQIWSRFKERILIYLNERDELEIFRETECIESMLRN